MAATRTNPKAVCKIVETDLAPDVVKEFIEDANVVVTGHLTGKGLSADQLRRIEKYIAAHLLILRDRRVATASVGQTRVRYQGRQQMHLNSTDYGQQAMLLDTSGCLRALGDLADVVKFVGKATGG